MDADLDTLATALYVICDDLLAQFPHRPPDRPAVGLAPRISGARILAMTTAIWHNDHISASVRRSLTAYDH